jgi:hypothetical protein
MAAQAHQMLESQATATSSATFAPSFPPQGFANPYLAQTQPQTQMNLNTPPPQMPMIEESSSQETVNPGEAHAQMLSQNMPSPSFMAQQPITQHMAPQVAPIEQQPAIDDKPLPRDLLLAKVRQYRETQVQRQRQPQPEQLSMDMGQPENPLEAARRLAGEIARSPFDSRNLDVPSFLRRKQSAPQPGQRSEEDESVPL